MKFRIWKYTDDELTPIIYIDDYISAIWTERFYECGEFELQLTATDELINSVKLDYIVERADVEPNTACIVEKIEITEDAESGKTVKLTGRSASCLTERRVMVIWLYGETKFWGYATKGTAGDAYRYGKKSKVNEVLREIVSRFCIDPDDNVILTGATPDVNADMLNRVIPFFACDSDDVLSTNDTKINMAEKGATVLEKLIDIGTTYGIGFRTIVSDSKIHIQFYDGTDRVVTQVTNDPVIFAESYGNAKTQNTAETTVGKVNVVYAQGCGEGTKRTSYCTEQDLLQFEDETPTKGLKRFESYYDHRDLGYMDDDGNPTIDGETSGYYVALENDAYEKIVDQAAVTEIEVLSTTQFTYRKDFIVGDYVTIGGGSTQTDTQIVEVIESDDAQSGYTISVSTSESALSSTDGSSSGGSTSAGGGGSVRYVLPPATYNTLGGVIVDQDTLTVDESGTISTVNKCIAESITNDEIDGICTPFSSTVSSTA